MALETKLIKKIIFDLDDTLFDTNTQLVQTAAEESCKVMIEAGLKATLEECLAYRKKIMATQTRCQLFENIAQHFGADGDLKAVSEAGSKQFHNRKIKEYISLFSDSLLVLRDLKEKYEIFLVTIGGLATQKKKVELLNLTPEFRKIFYVDITQRKTKTEAFKQILGLFPNLEPFSFLSVGNRIDSEIRDAKSLGMQTILFAHGEYLHLRAESPLEEPDKKIHKLSELIEVLK